MTYTDVMVDIETLGTAPGSVVLSIGAVAFDASREDETGWLTWDSHAISVASSKAVGLEVDAAKILWWSQQSFEVRHLVNEAMAGGKHIVNALQEFARWFPAGARLWGNGSDFDNVLLTAAYKRVNVEQPWKFYNNRCFRTMKNLYPQVAAPEFLGLKHDAAADALHQTRHLTRILRHINRAEEALDTLKCALADTTEHAL